MEDLASAIQASDLARALRQSRWTYPLINAAHILGVALLVGAVVPMDLRLIGVWRSDVRLQTVLRLLRPLAVAGAALALVTGALLFVVQASEYAATRLFYAKMALVAIGLGHALANPRIAGAPRRRQIRAGALSLCLWVTVLVCGRMLGYI